MSANTEVICNPTGPTHHGCLTLEQGGEFAASLGHSFDGFHLSSTVVLSEHIRVYNSAEVPSKTPVRPVSIAMMNESPVEVHGQRTRTVCVPSQPIGAQDVVNRSQDAGEVCHPGLCLKMDRWQGTRNTRNEVE